jgi:hypothetical protein
MSELIREDLPTFERPRNAISGTSKVFALVGKWDTSVADKRKTGERRIDLYLSLLVAGRCPSGS